MGWIKELDDLMSKRKSMKFLVIVALLVVIVAFASFCYVFIKAATQGQGVDISTGKISPKVIERQKDQDSVKPSITNKENEKKIKQHDNRNYPFVKKPIQKKNFPLKNETNNSGNNNHSINGDHNTVGVNGDVNISGEKQLNEPQKKEFSNIIDKLLIDSPNVSKCYEIAMRQNSNGQKIAAQCEEIFIKKGFSWGGSAIEGGRIFKGMVISINREHFNCITLTIGVID